MAESGVVPAGPSEVIINKWPGLDLSSLFSIGMHRGYTRIGFIQQCAMQLYSAVNFNDETKNPAVEANKAVQRAEVLASVLDIEGYYSALQKKKK